MKKPTKTKRIIQCDSDDSSCAKDPDTDELINTITYSKRPSETVTIDSSEDMDDCPHNNASTYAIERDACQMSPLLFESDTDDECSPLKCGQGSPTSIAYINPTSPTLPPDNVEYFKIFSGLYNLTSRHKAAKSCSEPIAVPDSFNRLSDKTNSEEQIMLPRRIPRKAIVKQELLEKEEQVTPRITRSLLRNDQIATRSKVKTGKINLSNRTAMMSRMKRSSAIAKSPLKPRIRGADDPAPLATNAMTKNAVDPDETEMIVSPETISTLAGTNKYDFDLSVCTSKKRPNSYDSTDLEIVSQNHVFVSLTSSSECPANGRHGKVKLSAPLRISPDIFTSRNDGAGDKTPLRTPFFSKPKPKLFEGLLETSTPLQWSQPLSDSSQDIFWDTSSTIGATSSSSRILALTSAKAYADDEPKSDVFEITKNDVFGNMIRVTSDSDMSPMRMSEDEEPVVAAAEEKVVDVLTNTPKRRPSCLDGLQIEKRCKPSETSMGDISMDDDTLAAAVPTIEVSSSDLDGRPSSGDVLQMTPKRTKLPKTIGRRWWSSPRKKMTKLRKTRTVSSSSSSVLNSPDIRRWFKKSNDEETPKTANRQRRLDLWFTSDASQNVSAIQPALITLSSDDDS